MEIRAVTTVVEDLDEAERFYGETFGLPTRRDADGPHPAVVVDIGTGVLTLRQGGPDEARDHLAFGIPADAFSAAKEWLRARVPLFATGGVDEFEGDAAWNSRSLYFPGPSHSVLELIARRRLPASAGGDAFDATQLLGISEVGIAVSEVPAAVSTLGREADLTVFGDMAGPDFAPVGDDHGLFILVRPGRAWFPTGDRLSRTAPMAVTATGSRTGDVVLGGARVGFTT